MAERSALILGSLGLAWQLPRMLRSVGSTSA